MPTLSVMTFNVRGALFDDGANRWSNRAELNVQTIARYAPDLLGFQETQRENLEFYGEHLPGYEHVLGPHYNDTAPYQYPTIMWNPQRLHLIDSGGFWLSHTPERHSRAWDTACIRSATWSRLRWHAADCTLLHLNTHLDHISETARVEGAKLIVQQLEQLREADEPIIITGDFNCAPTSEAHGLFEEHGFVDSYTATGQRDVIGTFHGFRGPEYVPNEFDGDRIDWILLRDPLSRLAVTECTIVRDAAPPLYPSDHYPVLVAVEQVSR